MTSHSRRGLRNLERQLGLLKSEAFLRALNSIEFRRVAFSDQFLKAFSDVQLGAALENAEFRKMLADSDLRNGLRRVGLSQALGDRTSASWPAAARCGWR